MCSATKVPFDVVFFANIIPRTCKQSFLSIIAHIISLFGCYSFFFSPFSFFKHLYEMLLIEVIVAIDLTFMHADFRCAMGF